MKKNLLTIALVAGALLPVSAQWYQIGGTVKVKPGALKYVSGPQTITKGTESNEGKVQVGGAFTVVDNVAEFRNEFNSPIEYGQLIIAGGVQAKGKVVGEYKTPGNTNFYKAPIAIPYIGVTADQIADAAGITTKDWQNHERNGIYSSNRWRNPVNVWDNTHYALRDLRKGEEVTQDGLYKPTNYYSVNNKVDGLGYRQTDYSGIPANMAHSVVLTPFKVDGRTNYKRNIYGEVLGSYLTDPFGVTPAGWGEKGDGPKNRPEGYGDNYFYLGNPYTSNVDLTEVLNNTNILGVVQYTDLDYREEVGSNFNRGGYSQKISRNGSGWIGDKSVLKLRPYHTFGVKTNGQSVTLSLNDNVKTFKEDAKTPKYTARMAREEIKQVQIKLIDPIDDSEVLRTYVAASNYFQASGKAGNQAYIPELRDSVDGIYTLEENEDGTYMEEAGKLYINGVNEDNYVGKPIYIVHQVARPGNYNFLFTPSGGVDANNKFFFEDRVTGILKEITDSQLTYEFNASETSKERFVLYWKKTPMSLSVQDNLIATKHETVVYKDNSSFKVRFAKDINRADVYVYNVLGQLVHSKQGVNTSADYVLPLDNSSSAYVVKIVGDNGKVTTKKIVK